MTVGNVGGIQDQAFLSLISAPQAFSAGAPEQVGYQQPTQDSFQYQEPEKKGGFGKFLLGLVIAAGLVAGGARIANKNGKLNIAKGEKNKFVNKFIKKPASKVDDWVMKQVDTIKGLKIFKGNGDSSKSSSEANKSGGESK